MPLTPVSGSSVTTAISNLVRPFIALLIAVLTPPEVTRLSEPATTVSVKSLVAAVPTLGSVIVVTVGVTAWPLAVKAVIALIVPPWVAVALSVLAVAILTGVSAVWEGSVIVVFSGVTVCPLTFTSVITVNDLPCAGACAVPVVAVPLESVVSVGSVNVVFQV